MKKYNFTQNSYGDRYLKEVNGKIFSTHEAHPYLQSIYKDSLLEKDRLYIVVGTDSGLLPQFVADNITTDTSEYIFIEDDEIFEHVAHLLPKHPKIHYCNQNNWQANNNFDIKLYFRSSSTVLIRSISVRDGSLEEHNKLFQAIQKQFTQFDAEINSGTNILPFLHIGLSNIPDNQHNMSTLKDKLKGKTAIILGAAPSLDEHIHWIKEIQDKVYILAVARIARKLIEYNITPDFLVSVDPQIGSFHISKEMYEYEDQSILIHSYHGNPKLIGQWLGDKYFTGSRYPWVTKLNSDDSPQTGNTVTNTALDSALIMGFETILLAGVDFCFKKSGETHTKNTGTETDEAAVIATTDRHLNVINNKGEEVETGFGYYQASKQFTKAIKLLSSKEQSIINISETAISMDEVLYTPRKNIKIKRNTPKTKITPPNEKKEEYYKSCKEELKRAKKELHKISIDSKKIINLITKKSYNDKNIKKIEKKINRNKELLNLIKITSSTKMLRVLRAARNKDTSWNQDEVDKSHKAYFEIVHEQCKGLIHTIERTITKTETRECELKHKITSDTVEAWINDGQPRRALHWKRSHEDTFNNLTNDLQKKITEAINLSDKEINTDINKTYQRNKNILIDSFTRIKKSYDDRDIDSLYTLNNKLTKYPNQPELPVSISLCEASIDHMNHNHEQAFEKFARILSEKDILNSEIIEFVLEKVSSSAIELKDFKNALLALETLSTSFSDHYTPIYARLLHATGNTELSIQTLTNYINNNPNDFETHTFYNTITQPTQ